MNRNNVFPPLALAAAVAAALGLSSCAAASQPATDPGSGAGTTAPAAPTSATAGTSATPAPSSTATTTAAASAGASTANPTPAATTATATAATATPTASSAGVKIFTFPDGHLSFSYPSGWTVRIVGTAEDAAKLRGVQAVIADATGNDVASIVSSTNASNASGPVARTVLDAAPVPGLKDVDGEQLAFGFAFDSFADQSDFHMSVRKERDFGPAVSDSGSAYIGFANGGAEAKVLFGSPAFASVDAAKTWMTTEQYGQLKRLLLSLKYA